MEIQNHELPPQEYVEYNGEIYYIGWNNPPLNVQRNKCFIKPLEGPPIKLIEKDNITYWKSHKGRIFSSDENKRNVKILSLLEFYNLTYTWNIPFTKFPLPISTL